MTTAVARPYLTADPSAVSIDECPWTVSINERPEAIDEIRTQLRVVETVTLTGCMDLNVAEIRASALLPDDAELQAVFLWECVATRRREIGARVPLTNETAISVDFGIPTAFLAESLKLERQVVLASISLGSPVLAAREAGSMIWRETRPIRVDLAGVGGVLPTEISRFSGTTDPDGVWVLDLDLSDLNDPATVAARLRLNENHPDISRLAAKEDHDDRSRALLSMIHWDVGRSLVGAAIDDPEFDLDAEYMGDSIGRSLQLLVAGLFPGHSVESLRELRLLRSTEYDSTLQARLQLLRGRKYRRYAMTSGQAENESTASGT